VCQKKSDLSPSSSLKGGDSTARENLFFTRQSYTPAFSIMENTVKVTFEIEISKDEFLAGIADGWIGASPALASASPDEKFDLFRQACDGGKLLEVLELPKDRFVSLMAAEFAPAANAAQLASEERLKKEDPIAYIALIERKLAEERERMAAQQAAQAAAHALELEKARDQARVLASGGGGRAARASLLVGGGGSAAAATPSPKNKGGRKMEGQMPDEFQVLDRDYQREWCYEMWMNSPKENKDDEFGWAQKFIRGVAALPKGMEKGSEEHKDWCLDVAWPRVQANREASRLDAAERYAASKAAEASPSRVSPIRAAKSLAAAKITAAAAAAAASSSEEEGSAPTAAPGDVDALAGAFGSMSMGGGSAAAPKASPAAKASPALKASAAKASPALKASPKATAAATAKPAPKAAAAASPVLVGGGGGSAAAPATALTSSQKAMKAKAKAEAEAATAEAVAMNMAVVEIQDTEYWHDPATNYLWLKIGDDFATGGCGEEIGYWQPENIDEPIRLVEYGRE
jgi:hypothetical protein